jgi:hypothetical protein
VRGAAHQVEDPARNEGGAERAVGRRQEDRSMTETTFGARLQRIPDELRVRAHLAAMDARDAWDRAHLERIGDELVTLRDEARVQAHLGTMDARDAWARIDGELRELAAKSGAAADDAVSTIVHAAEEILRRGDTRSQEKAR